MSSDQFVDKKRRMILLGVPSLIGLASIYPYANILKSSHSKKITISVPKKYNYLAFEAGLVDLIEKQTAASLTLTQVLETPDVAQPQFISSLSLRQMFPEMQTLAGLPFGHNVKDRLGNLEQFQNDINHICKNKPFELFHVGSFNNSYGRYFKKSSFGTTTIGSTGLRAAWFKNQEHKVSNSGLLDFERMSGSWISDAYPHYFNSKFVGSIKADGYMIDEQTRSAESLFLLIPKNLVSEFDPEHISQLKIQFKKISEMFSQTLLDQEQIALKQIEQCFQISQFELPQHFLSKYIYWLEENNSTYNQQLISQLTKKINSNS